MAAAILSQIVRFPFPDKTPTIQPVRGEPVEPHTPFDKLRANGLLGDTRGVSIEKWN
jgi:hypothetical protein